MYLISNNRKLFSKPIHIFTVIIVSLLFLIILARFTPASYILSSIKSTIYSINLSMNTFVIQTFSSTDSLKSQVEHYQFIAQQAVINKAYMYELEYKVKELESILNYQQTVEYDITVSQILSRLQSDDFTLLIDKGAHDNIEKGFAVIVDDGYIIGIVDSVMEYTSVVRLLLDPKTSIPVSLLNNESPSGLLVGEGGYQLKMQYIPQDREINIGDIAVTTDLFEKIPNNLIIGTVSEIIENETSPFKEAIIEPIFGSSEYLNVVVIKSNAIKIYEE